MKIIPPTHVNSAASDGRVLVFHGSRKSGFLEFDREKVGVDSYQRKYSGFYFSSHLYDGAASYSGSAEMAVIGGPTHSGVYPAYLKFKNPLVINLNHSTWNEEVWSKKHGDLYGMDHIEQYARENGYDGVIAKNANDLGGQRPGLMDYENFTAEAKAAQSIERKMSQGKSFKAAVKAVIDDLQSARGYFKSIGEDAIAESQTQQLAVIQQLRPDECRKPKYQRGHTVFIAFEERQIEIAYERMPCCPAGILARLNDAGVRGSDSINWIVNFLKVSGRGDVLTLWEMSRESLVDAASLIAAMELSYGAGSIMDNNSFIRQENAMAFGPSL